MPEIEFLDVAAAPVPPPEPSASVTRARGTLVAALVLAVGALAAAALAVCSPFLPIYHTTLSGDGVQADFSYDGWGRAFSGSVRADDNGHGVRYGVVLVAGGVLFVVAAGLALYPVIARRGSARLLGALRTAAWAVALAGAAVTAAMSATCYLESAAAGDDVAIERAQDSTGIHEAAGACWWVAAVAAVMGLLAVGTSVVLWRRSSQPAQSLAAYGARSTETPEEQGHDPGDPTTG